MCSSSVMQMRFRHLIMQRRPVRKPRIHSINILFARDRRFWLTQILNRVIVPAAEQEGGEVDVGATATPAGGRPEPQHSNGAALSLRDRR